jgi:histidinol-phosphatase (PHP family)
MLQGGVFEGERLRKSLEYAKSMGKTVRMNALMFYMDCPDEIYNLEQNSTSSAIAREKLETYVDSVTGVMSEYPGVVRSVDVFNELLNRHPMSGDVPYMVRGDIPQDMETSDFDNIKSGWLKHLTVEDICEVMQVARRNLPNVDFMYNDDFLTDPKKLSATIELVRRIQDYSKGLGIQLIDSIGTQMHIDNDVSKEEIRNMFLGLKELGLPIEITEFDLAMTCGVDGLSTEQIEILRQKKINEIFEVVEELKDECNIRGFTIWSKTDSQNFRVTLANEIAHKEGREFISTLHGGVFTEEMAPKSAEMSKKVRKQNFNYHGHTSRCGHASELSDDLYVVAARNQGLSRIGFSDHVAFGPLENWQQGKRMHISEIDGYIASIRKLQEENPDMVIRCGFEAEYDPGKKGYLAELRKSCDYMILGQHYVQNGMGLIDTRDNPDYPLIYANMVCEAMETGIFDIFAHPDYFMLERDKCSSDESYALFMENAKKASLMICTKAKEMGIPLELNVRGAKEYKEGRDSEFVYPHSLFWSVASEVGNEVIYAVDAHHPSHIMSIDEDRDFVETKIDTSKLTFVSDEYDPVIAREDNLSLQEAYEESLETGITHETSLIQMLISRVDVSEGENAYEKIGELLSGSREKFINDCSERLRKMDERIAALDDNTSYTEEQRSKLRAKWELRKERIIETCEARERAVDRAQVSLSEAHEIGCETKDEFVQVIGYLTEEKTSSNPVAIENASNSIEAFKESKETSKTESASVGEKPKTLIFKPLDTGTASDGNSSPAAGFSSSLNLLIVIGMLVLFGIIASFMIG